MKRALTFLLIPCCAAMAIGAQKYSVKTYLTGQPGPKAPADKMVEAGKKVTISVSPGKDCVVDAWGENGHDTFGAGNSYTFTMPADDVTLTANVVDATTDAQELDEISFTIEAQPSTSVSIVGGKLRATVGLRVCGMLKSMVTKPSSKLTAKPLNLPKGLSLVASSVSTGPSTYQCWIIEGVATEPLDPDLSPAFVTFTTPTKATRTIRLPLSVQDDGPVSGPAPTAGVPCGEMTLDNYCPGTGWTVKKGLPPGFKFDKTTGKFSGTATSAGIFLVECSRTLKVDNKSYTETCFIRINVKPSPKDSSFFNSLPSSFLGYVGEGIAKDFGAYLSGGTSPKVVGLPGGLKYTDKAITIKSKGVTEMYDANYVYGVPTKAGAYTVTLSKKVNGTERTMQTVWTILPADAPPIHSCTIRDADGNTWSLGNSGWNAAAVVYAGQRVDAMESSETIFQLNVPHGSTVSKSGLPSGLNLVFVKSQGISDIYAIGGMTTKAGASIATFKITKDGATRILRLNIDVQPNPFQGTLRGIVTSNDTSPRPGPFNLGEAVAIIDAAGTCKLTMNDGKKKATVTIKGYNKNGNWAMFEGTLPKDKDVPERKLFVEIESYTSASGIRLPVYGSGSIYCDSNHGCHREISLHLQMDNRYERAYKEPAEEKLSVSDWTLPYQHYTFGMNATGANKQRLGFAGGYIALAHKTKANVSDFLQATATGRTPDGAKFTTTVYPLFDEELTEDNNYRYSPIVVYNKSTGRTWLFTMIDWDLCLVSFYDDVLGSLGYKLFEASDSEDTYGLSTNYRPSLYTDFSSFFLQSPSDAGQNLNVSLASYDQVLDKGEYVAIDELLSGFGTAKAAYIKPTFDKSTGIVSFKHSINGITITYEGVLAEPGWIRGWCSFTQNRITYHGAFNLRTW